MLLDGRMVEQEVSLRRAVFRWLESLGPSRSSLLLTTMNCDGPRVVFGISQC
jgi:hypothetical protein